MSRIQPLVPLLRPLAFPRAAVYQQKFRFSIASRFQVDQSSAKPSIPPNASPETPSAPKDAQRAADLAAAEAVTEADSAQPPEPKPILPSSRSKEQNVQRDLKASKDSMSSTSKPEGIHSSGPPSPQASSSSTTIPREAKSAKLKAKPNTTQEHQQPPPSQPADPSFVSTPITPQKELRKPKTSIKHPKPQSQQQQQQQQQIPLPPPKYHINRSHNNNLPIYSEYKRGGNLQLTTVRKVSGDLSALRDELRVLLDRKNEDVKVNSVTKHVVVKGKHVEQIWGFLVARGM